MTARDSLEKIVTDMRRPITLHQCPICGGPHGVSDERQWERIAARIEALIPSKEEREFLRACEHWAAKKSNGPSEYDADFPTSFETRLLAAEQDVLHAYRALLAERGKDA